MSEFLDSGGLATPAPIGPGAAIVPEELTGLPPGPRPTDRLRFPGNMLHSLGNSWQRIMVAVPFGWMLLFFLIPFAIVLKIGFADSVVARPPFTPLLSYPDGDHLALTVTWDNFASLWQDDLYLRAYLNSLKIAAISTVFCLLLGYPMALAIARATRQTRNIMLLVVVLPFWTPFLLRVYAWLGILDTNGLLNRFLQWAHLTHAPMQMLYTPFAVYVGIVYSYLPFMILPLYASLERLDRTLDEAAADLGAKPFSVFRDITFPLSIPGVIAGSLLVFIPAVGEYVIPDLLGNASNVMIGRVLYDEFFSNRDWPTASAVAIALLLALVIPMILFQYLQAKQVDAP
jgi:putrescine transport system permease protein